MREIAAEALVSEATIYRYFPDLASLLAATMDGVWPEAEQVVAELADVADPVRRVGRVAEDFLRRVLRYQRAIRAVVAATVTHPEFSGIRPGHRFPFIDAALASIPADALPPDRAARLARQLAGVLSPGALFDLIDLCGLTEDEAVDTTLGVVTTLVERALA